MGKQPAAPQEAGGGEPRSRARAHGTARSTRGPAQQPPAMVHHREESIHGARHAVAPRDGSAGTDAAVEGGGGHRPYPIKPTEVWAGGELGPEQSPVLGDAGSKAPARRTPSYQPVQKRWVVEGQPQAALPRKAARHGPPAQHADVPEEPEVPPGGPAGVKLHESRYERPTEVLLYSPSMLLRRKDKERQPFEFCFTAYCILFWLLVIAVGMAVLIIFLLYHPQSPNMRVTSATLNAGYVDELGGPAGGGPRALNADLTVLAAIYNPNTKLHIVLRYMQLDLYFQGSMIGTQAVRPAPLHEGPRGNVLRSVHLVVSEVTMTHEDVSVWQNATTKGGPVVLQLAGRFRTQLIFGRWFRFKYWVTPQCTLWLDPPPSGALRRARC